MKFLYWNFRLGYSLARDHWCCMWLWLFYSTVLYLGYFITWPHNTTMKPLPSITYTVWAMTLLLKLATLSKLIRLGCFQLYYYYYLFLIARAALPLAPQITPPRKSAWPQRDRQEVGSDCQKRLFINRSYLHPLYYITLNQPLYWILLPHHSIIYYINLMQLYIHHYRVHPVAVAVLVAIVMRMLHGHVCTCINVCVRAYSIRTYFVHTVFSRR